MEKQKILEKINEIIRLSFEINDFEKRTTETMGNKPTVFFNFSGHVCNFGVYIYSNGWESDSEADMNFNFYLNNVVNELALSNCIRTLTQFKEELEEKAASRKRSVLKQITIDQEVI